MPDPTVPERITTILTNLTTTTDLIAWAHTNGHQPNRPNPDARQRTPKPAPPDAGPDWTPGPRHDIGIAIYDTRRAYQVAVQRLAHTETRTAHACHLIAGHHRDLITPSVYTDIALVVRCCRNIRGMTIDTRDDWPAAHPSHQLAATFELEIVASHLDIIVTGLLKAFNRGPADPAAMDIALRCKNHSRGCPNERIVGRSKRCYACLHYWTTNGRDKPAKEFRSDIAFASQAQQRRRDRGDGWGDESASATNLRPIIDERHAGILPFEPPAPRPLVTKRTGKRHPRRFTGPTKA